MAKMTYRVNFLVCIVVSLSVIYMKNSVNAQKPNIKYNAFVDIANTFFQDKNGMTGIAQAISSLMKKSSSDATQILAGINQLINVNNENGASDLGGLDPATIKNLIDVFTHDNNGDNELNEIELQKRRTNNSVKDHPINPILSITSVIISNLDSDKGNEISKNLLPLALQVVKSFAVQDSDNVQSIFNQINFLLNQFVNPELTLWEKSGITQIFKDFYDRDGELDYEKLLNSLNNQAFRRKWLKSTVSYVSEWTNYITTPDVYKRISTSAQFMFNSILMMQEVPSHALFDVNRPSESIANLLDFIAHKYLHKKISSIAYVQPIVTYISDLITMDVAHDLFQIVNTPKLNDMFIDIINLEVIEPILKVHRAYRFALHSPQCDKYVLCKVNSRTSEETLDLYGVKPKIIKLTSMVAAWTAAKHTGTPFWTLLSVIFELRNCKEYYRAECLEFHEGEEKITMDYIHNEL